MSVVVSIADVLRPFLAASATAAAIVVFTAAVRLLLHPLARAAMRGEKSRQALAPKLARLRDRHGHDRQRLTRDMAELYRTERASPLAGCLPMLAQLPVFFVMYQLFTTTTVAGHVNPLLTDTLAGVPLGWHLSEALTGTGGGWLVFLALFAALAAVASWSYRHARQAMAASATPGPAAGLARVMPLLSFGTVVVAAVVPLAAGVYLLATTTWTVAERALLRR